MGFEAAGAAQEACRGGLDCRSGAGQGEERTENMKLMVVTLEVSKLSGWLSADASCRESKGGHAVGAGRGAPAGAGWRWRATAVKAAFRAGLHCRLGAKNREERTPNMPPMSVTLEVSKLSGWLNDDAPCRESKGGHTVCGAWRYAGGRAAGGGATAAASNVQERARLCRLGAGHGEERTENMKLMVVTLEVSKLSGWLNDAAPCRKGEAYGAGRAPGRGPAGEVAHAACRAGLGCR